MQSYYTIFVVIFNKNETSHAASQAASLNAKPARLGKSLGFFAGGLSMFPWVLMDFNGTICGKQTTCLMIKSIRFPVKISNQAISQSHIFLMFFFLTVQVTFHCGTRANNAIFFGFLSKSSLFRHHSSLFIQILGFYLKGQLGLGKAYFYERVYISWAKT